MQEIKAFNEKRAEIYWWLSSLMAKELTQKDLDQYHSAPIRSFLTGLGENETLKPAVMEVVDALNRQLDRNDAQLELAADFCELFLKSDKDSALPYASMYIGKTGLLNDEPAKNMETLMQQYGVQVDKNLNEPADHIAIQLDFLGNMIIQSNVLETETELEKAFSEQEAFIDHHLLSWTPKFAQKCKAIDKFGFYTSIVTLLVAFLQLDVAYLKGE